MQSDKSCEEIGQLYCGALAKYVVGRKDYTLGYYLTLREGSKEMVLFFWIYHHHCRRRHRHHYWLQLGAAQLSYGDHLQLVLVILINIIIVSVSEKKGKRKKRIQESYYHLIRKTNKTEVMDLNCRQYIYNNNSNNYVAWVWMLVGVRQN